MPQRDDSLTRNLGISKRRRMRNLSNQEPTQAAQVTGSASDGPKQGDQFEIPGCATIIVPASSIDTTLTGFVVPYPLSEAPAELWADSVGTGKDLYVLDSLGVRIPAHVFLYDDVAETGFVFFRTPTLSSSVDNTFLLCWGDSLADFVPQGQLLLTSEITNPGAESGDTTGWTLVEGTMVAAASSPHSGTWRFESNSLDMRASQVVDIPSVHNTIIDSGQWAVQLKWWQGGGSVNYGMMGLEFLDASSVSLDDEWKASGRGVDTWTQREFSLIPPAGTRKIKIWIEGKRNAAGDGVLYDDIELGLKNVDVMKQWGVWQDYLGAGMFEDAGALNFGPGEPTLNIQSFGGNAPVYSALTMGAGAGVTVGGVGAYRGFMGIPINTDQFSQGVTMIPSAVAEQQVIQGFTKRTSASEPPNESQWIYHAAGGDLRTIDDINPFLSAAFTLVNGTAYRIHVVYDAGAARRIYRDGIETEDLVITVATEAFNTLCLAHEDQSASEQWEGGIAYVWMRRDVISDAWATAEHLALSDPATFFNATVFSGGDGAYIRHDGTKWENVGISQLLADLLNVDGTGSGLDADLLDGVDGSGYSLVGHTHLEADITDLQDYLTEAGVNALLLAASGTLLHVTPENITSLPGFSFSRTGTATYTDVNGIIQTAADGELRNSHYENGVRTIFTEGAATNLLLNSFSPATQVVSIPNSEHTLSMLGSGSISASGATDGSYGSATAGSHLTFTPSVTQDVTFTVSGTVTHEQVETGTFPTSFIETSGSAVTRNADSLSVDFTALPQEMTVQITGVERGTGITGSANNARLTQIGFGTSVGEWRHYWAGGYRTQLFFSGGNRFTSPAASNPVLGDRVGVREVMAADGVLTTGQSINGAAETTQSSASGTIPTVWGASTLYINSNEGGGDVGYFAFESIRIATGIQSMESMRAAAAIAAIAADIVGQSTLASLDGSDPLQKIIAGDIEATQWTEASSGILISDQGNIGLTAHVGSSQGDGPITSSYNIYSTVANTGDAATLPDTFKVSTQVYVKNDGANSMDVFPASGDDAGAGVDTAVAVAAGVGALFVATVVDSTWTQMF